ncbi:hypothetical protein [Motilimonas eburnea]|uniref:T1SS-143 repeat domain-containing protein n=1 Tax=Motilimonas eburnea TaxID=1737488 RepID=UPI001E4428B1|nr:hypothetical protein [Motilimonas eburnea]MCE2570735.1 hypothetical protein [Motilimonas eburnea]
MVILYVEVDGLIWQVFADGRWLLLESSAQINPSLPFISDISPYITQGDDGALQLSIEQQVFTIPDSVVPQLGSITSSNVTRTDNAISPLSEGASYFATIAADHDEVIAKAGYQTNPGLDIALPRNEQPRELAGRLKLDAKITVTVDHGEDQVINREEAPSTEVFGGTLDIESGWPVLVVITDSQGVSREYSTTIVANTWSLGDVDFTGFAQGPLTVVASVTDRYGNTVSSETQSWLDTLAQVSVSFEQQGEDGVINLAETDNEQLSGKVIGIEDGQLLSVTLTDVTGFSQTFEIVVEGETWSLGEQDLTGFADGVIDAHISAVDLAGNTATGAATILKDTQASLTITVFDGGDDVLNLAESNQAHISGHALNIEDGQTVTVQVSDGVNQLEFTTIVINGQWQLPQVDLSTLQDGELNFTAFASDKAGNPASDSHQVLKDTFAVISLHINDGGDGWLNGQEILNVSGWGQVSGVEDGSLVTISALDAQGNSGSITVVVEQGRFWVNDLDLSHFAEGTFTATAVVTDKAGNSATASDSVLIDTKATLSVNILTGGDGALNQNEVLNAHITGTTFNVDQGEPIEISVTDVNGKTLYFETSVNNHVFNLFHVDLSELAEGPIKVSASTQDQAGNPATASATAYKDTLASVTLNVADGGDGIINQQESLASHFFGSVSQVEDGQVLTLTVSDGRNSAEFFATVKNGQWVVRDADISLLKDGPLTITAEVQDRVGNTALASETVNKDTLAEITLTIYDGGDGWLNSEEIQHVAAFGEVTGIADGTQIQITAIDAQGNTGSITTTVQQGRYFVTGLDLSAFADGEFTATATTVDNAGNPAQATDTVLIDTKATISVNILTGGDGVINQQESLGATIRGSVFEVNDGERVNITITDQLGQQINLVTQVDGNGYQISPIDLSTLADGPLQVSAEVTDKVGNLATANAQADKDTYAEITLFVDDGGDGWLNSIETQNGRAYGWVKGVEDGQVVTITATDSQGNTGSVTTIVENGRYLVSGLDISHFADGKFDVVASVSDQAGNVASAPVTERIDTLATLSLNIETHGDGVLNGREVGKTKLSGTTNDVNNGELVQISVTDQAGNERVFVTTVTFNYFEIPAADFSGLEEGPLVATAQVQDRVGNVATAQAQAVKDTLAELTINVDAGSDQVINDSEVTGVHIHGQASHIEDGQKVIIEISDGKQSQFYFAEITGGQWQLPDLDLTPLFDGELTFIALAKDEAGNVAIAEQQVEKDTTATIDLFFEQQLSDSILNASEADNEILAGRVTSVEDGRWVQVVVSDQNGDSLILNAQVNNGRWFILGNDLTPLQDGPITAVATVQDLAGNIATANTQIIKDTQASINILIESGTDNVLNSAEINGVHIHGTVVQVENGQTVNLVVSDANGNTVNAEASVKQGKWSVDNLDLSSLEEGELTATATVQDKAGNTAQASDDAIKDVLAQTLIFIKTNGDGRLNAQESANATFVGGVKYIEDGALVTVVVTDSLGLQAAGTAVIKDGLWTATGLDLTGFSDGPLTAVASVTDQAGNVATASDTVLKDVLSVLTVGIESGGDNLLNASEINQVVIFGQTNDVEDGDVVRFTITDGVNTSAQYSAVVVDGKWSHAPLDLSGFNEGALTVNAQVEDLAGNPASASASAVKDTLAQVSIEIITGSDDTLNQLEVGQTRLQGDVSQIEDGQLVDVVVQDQKGQQLSFQTTVIGGKWVLPSVDLSGLAEGDNNLTARVEVADLAGNLVSATDVASKDTLATISVEFVSGSDDALNASEINQVDIVGSVTDVEDGRDVAIVVTDVNGVSQHFSVQVSGGQFSLVDLDLSSLAEGTLTVMAEVTDVAGNLATASDTVNKDTLLAIDIDTLTGLNATEFILGKVTELFGTTTAEAGQVVTLLIQDASSTLTYTSVVDSSGQWRVPNIDVSSLSRFDVWSISAQVADQAGNSVQDETPDLNAPQYMLMFEVDLNKGALSDSTALEVTNGELTFSADQSQLKGLSSGGQGITANISSNQLQIELRRDGDGKLVSIAVLDPSSARVSVTQFLPLDQEAGKPSSLITYLVDVQQIDADGTQEKVILEASLNLRDAPPFAQPDLADVIEDQVQQGNLLDNDQSIDAPLTLTSVTYQGVTQSVNGTTDAVFDTDKGKLTVDVFGHWQLEVARNLNHQQTQELNFSYQIQDSDKDSASADVTLTIIDGDKGEMADVREQYTEPDYANPTPISHDFTLSSGSDDLDASTVKFANLAVISLNTGRLTSNGELVIFTLSSDGKQIIGHNGVAEVIRFDISAVSQANGVVQDVKATVTLTQSLPFDHQVSDNLTLPLAITATDLDGTAMATGQFIWQVADGNNPFMENTRVANLDETDLNAGNVVAVGDFTVNIGSDQITQVWFDPSKQPAGLTSGTVPINYVMDGDTLIAYKGLDPTKDHVFSVEIKGALNATGDSDLQYQVTLFQAIDQLDVSNNSVAELEIPLVVSVKDFDQDQVDQTLLVNIADSQSPDITGFGLTVTEIPKAPTTPSVITNSGQSTLTLTASQDALTKVGLEISSGSAVLLSDGSTLMHNGLQVTWQDDGNGSYKGVLADGTRIFTVTLPSSLGVDPNQTAQATLNFTLHQAIDHDLSNFNNNASLNLPVFVSDSDGSTGKVTISVNINDGLNPSLAITDTLQVDENQLQSEDFDADKIGFVLNQGSDDVVAINPVLAGQAIPGLTSHGEPVVLAGAANKNGWWLAKAGSQEVFRIQFNLDGTIKVQLKGPIDHLGSDDTVKTISLAVQAVDADGDVSAASQHLVNLEIADDIPSSQVDVLAVVEGSTKTFNLLSDKITGADGGEIVKVILPDNSEHPVGTAIVLVDDKNTPFGTLTINADGTGTLVTQVAPVGLGVFENIRYVVEDFDGDQAQSYLELVVADKPGEITITNTDTIEDTPLTLDLKVSTGDQDNGERVTHITIDKASLQGGSITLNGGALSTDVDGNLIINAAQLEEIGTTGVFQVIGDLVFTPALNSSDATQILDINFKANVATNSMPFVEENTIRIHVESDADAPIWDTSNSQFSYSGVEDGEAIQMQFKADLYDQDGSEKISYVIDNIQAGLTVSINGSVITNGDTVSATELDKLTLTMDAQTGQDLAGSFVFTIQAVATEKDNGDTESGAANLVIINVAPDADKPTLSVKDVRGLEDELILLNKAIEGALTDLDGSESLSFEVTLPADWSLVPIDGGRFTALGGDKYQVNGEDLLAGKVALLPKEDISSVSGSFFVSVKAIATESTQGGVVPVNETAESTEKQFEVILKGVVDTPTVIADGDWVFDDATQVISNSTVFYEDSLIPLNIHMATEDDDGSEDLNLLLSGVPDGFALTDASGNAAAITVAHFDEFGQPVYQVTVDELKQLYLKPKPDFSGVVKLNIEAIVTEPDGDSEPDGDAKPPADDSEYALTLEVNISPVIDSTGLAANSGEGLEDTQVALNLRPNLGADQDGSESVSAFTIKDMPAGMTLYFDGVAQTVPLDLASLVDGRSPTLDDLLASGRLAVAAPTDASGTFNFNVAYDITDTSEAGETVTQSFTDSASVTVIAQVEELTGPGNETLADITRLQSDHTVRESTDGSPIRLSGAVGFYDQDNDGSEVLDYIVIQAPNATTWYVEYGSPNQAIHDGNGRWLIPAGGLTSTSVMENAANILKDVQVHSSDKTLFPVSLAVSARVLDGDDAEMITTSIQVHFKQDSADSSASDVDDLQPIDPAAPCDNVIDGQEGQVISTAGHLNTSVAGDSNDEVSFTILASELAHGAIITGPGVVADYDPTGKYVVQYVFQESAIGGLNIVLKDKDFAGVMTIPVHVTATDSISGDTRSELQQLKLEITPVVDGVDLTVGADQINEDEITPLDLTAAFADSNITNEGVEALTGLTLVLNEGGSLIAPDGVLTKISDSPVTYQVSDMAQLDQISYLPPPHRSGEITIGVVAEVTDTAPGCNGSTNTATGTATTTLVLDVQPITDKASITASNVRGDEDTYISLQDLGVNFIDQDGSETMSIELSGVPAGSIVAIDNGGGSYTPVPNNGPDGGSFNGLATYSWAVDPADLAKLVIKPPLDFSGDIPLQVNVITYEIGTTDFVTTEGNFTLEVLPIGDDVQLFNAPDALTGQEGDVTHIDLNAVSLETNSNELIRLSVTVEFGSDLTAFEGLSGIRVGSQEAGFTLTGKQATATLIINASELDGFELITGPDAFGHFDLTVSVGTFDKAIVGGVLETDLGDPAIHHMTLDLTPVVDEPILTSQFDQVLAAQNSSVPLTLEMELINPDPSETGSVRVSGLPAGVTFNHGVADGADWLLTQDELADLTLEGLSQVQDFELTFTPIATLGSDQAQGTEQIIKVSVVNDTGSFTGSAADDIIVAGSGNDTLTGGTGADQFVFNAADQGTPAQDVITDFSVGEDSINLSNLLASVDVSNASALDNVIDLDDSSGSTLITIKLDGTNQVQTIELSGVDIDTLYGESSSGVSEADILTRLVNDQTLITGQ